MTDKQRQELIDDMLFQQQNRENEFPVIDEKGNFCFPIYDCKTGIRYGYDKYLDDDEIPVRYRGLVLEVNDHGNVTVWKQFKNGNRREVASRV